MKRFIIIFLSLSLVELGVYFSPIRIDKTENPNARFTLPSVVDSLDMKYDGHILVKVKINHDTVDHWFLWDTGAQASFIDEELANYYNLRGVGIGRNVDSNLKARETIRYQADSLRFNNALFEDFIFSGLHIEKPKCGEKKYRGIIGANIIGRANWIIDYQNKRLFLVNSDSAEKAVAWPPLLQGPWKQFTVPFNPNRSKGVPKISISTKGQTIKDVIFDTGYNGNIVLPIEIYEENDSLANDSTRLKSYGDVSKGLFGTTAGDMVQIQVDSVMLGDLSLSDQVLNFQSKTFKLLGNRALQDFFVYLRYDSYQLSLIQRPVQEASYSLKKKGYGFRFRWTDGKLLVTMVNDDSPAFEAGLEYEDEILCINESRFRGDECEVSEWYADFICERILLEVKDKGTLELEFKRE